MICSRFCLLIFLVAKRKKKKTAFELWDPVFNAQKKKLTAVRRLVALMLPSPWLGGVVQFVRCFGASRQQITSKRGPRNFYKGVS